MLNMPEVADTVDYDSNHPSLRKESRRGEGFSEVSPDLPFPSFLFCVLFGLHDAFEIQVGNLSENT
jgi:hypothetical protein